MEKATERHFFKHGKEGLDDEKANCHWCQIRAFPGHKDYPITIVNDVDGAVIPPQFRFVKAVVLGPGVEAAGDSFRAGCSCAADNDCRYAECVCLEEYIDDDDDDDDDNEGARQRARRHGGRVKAYAYRSQGPSAGMLEPKMLNSRKPIYECHEACSCSKDCPNRVVERGRRLPLQIFRTKSTGWGVRCPVDIKRGQYIDNYVGEVITAEEAAARREASDIAARKEVYLFGLDKFSDPRSYDPRLRGPPLEVDGEFVSGPTRFVNHSCDPNLRIFARVGDRADRHLHDLAFFAVKDIPRMTELTFDYVDGQDGDGAEEGLDLARKHEVMTRCLCATAKCRGYLW